MIRCIAGAAALVLAVAAPALAQTHSHSQGHATTHGHAQHDSVLHAHHAAMHALLMGSWKGTLNLPTGGTSQFDLSVAMDSLHAFMLKMHGDSHMQPGASRNFMIDAGKVQWTQEIAGKPCTATATLNAEKPREPHTMQGKMACEHGTATFTLQKKHE